MTAGKRMATVGVRELKNRLTRYLQRARMGEEVVVTDRGKPIALIRAIHSAQPAQSLDARLARVSAGRLARRYPHFSPRSDPAAAVVGAAEASLQCASTAFHVAASGPGAS